MTGPIAVGDFNNDGKLDILGTSGSALSVLLGNGDGTFGFPLNSPTSTSVAAMAVADFNHDGKLDVALLTGICGATVEVYLGNGDGTFSLGPTYAVGTSAGSIAIGDLNGDAIPDLVVGTLAGYCSQYASSVSVLLGAGNGTFQAPITTVTGNKITSLAIADFNLDGKQDVAISNGGWNDISVLLGNGDGTLQAPMQYHISCSTVIGCSGELAVGDFDGNGSPDLVVADEHSGNLSLLLSPGKNGPGAMIWHGSLGFGNQFVGQTSSPQTVSLTYRSSSALNITGIAVTGAQNSDFRQTNNCGTSLASGANCTITIAFSPQAAGMRAASLQVTDKAANSPQMISLSGMGQDFSISVPSSSQTVSPGQSATYTLTVSPGGGFNQMVSMTCSGAPAHSTCGISPSSFTMNGSASQLVTVTMATTGPSTALTQPPTGPNSGDSYAYGLARTWFGLGLAVLVGFGGWRHRWRGWSDGVTFACLLCIAITLLGCGGGSGGGGGGGGGGGIRPGTYQLTVTGDYTSGMVTLTHNVTLTLIVQ